MKTYTIEEIRQIAAETSDPETIARFETYIANGWVGPVAGVTKRPTGKFKPMLAIKADLDQIKTFPIIGSLKYDGVRGILHPEFGLISRASKPIANNYIREKLESLGVSHLDGEIVTFTNGKQDKLNVVTSKVNSADGEPNFKFFVFDDFEYPEFSYAERLNNARSKMKDANCFWIGVINYVILRNKEQLISYEEKAARLSEGLILRRMEAPYKSGRATLRKGELIKIKRFMDDEGIILEINQIENGLPMVGSFVVSWNGIIFNLGNGWTDKEAEEMWKIRRLLKGKKVTFKFEGTGPNGAPKFSTFLAIREDV